MEEYLKTPIKDLIGRFPRIGTALDEYGIGCVPCSVGTCLLSDIVEIHDLPPRDEAELMARIAGIVAPGRIVVLPEPRKGRAAGPRKLAYSPPMKRLVDEHTLIKRFIALVPAIVDRLDVESDAGRRTLLDGVDFIRSYADRYHHAKEEDILFSYFDPGLDILKAMHEDHARGRGHVKDLLDALGRKDREGAAGSLAGYASVLSEHIRKEDEILYPWMDRNLSTRQVGEMFSKFREADGRFPEVPARSEAFVEMLEEKLARRRAEVIR